jgi:hypothetical protein
MTWVAGCRSPESPAPQSDVSDLADREESPDLNDEYGGFNLRDDQPAFGDPELASEFVEEEAVLDRYAEDEDVVDENRLDRPRHFLMITWGNLHRDESITHRTDWSGSLSISSGAIVLKRIIRFENNDKILDRTHRDLLEWESMTGRGYDGVLVRMVPRPSEDALDSEANTDDVVITFDTEPFQVRFKASQLPGLNRVVTLDDGNAIAFQTITLQPAECPHGPMRGIWANHPERPGGFLIGKWGTPDGRIKGFIKGHYGTNDEGKKVFFGKMIDMNGRFEGLVKGEWGHQPSVDVASAGQAGWYSGRWIDRNLGIKGKLKGNWERSAHCDGGFFRGVWAKKCN